MKNVQRLFFSFLFKIVIEFCVFSFGYSRYFVNGICREGSNCRYQHIQGTRQDPIPAATTTTYQDPEPNAGLCRYVKQGSCKFGGRCRFKHSPNEESTSGTAGSSSSSHSNTNTLVSNTATIEDQDNE